MWEMWKVMRIPVVGQLRYRKWIDWITRGWSHAEAWWHSHKSGTTVWMCRACNNGWLECSVHYSCLVNEVFAWSWFLLWGALGSPSAACGDVGDAAPNLDWLRSDIQEVQDQTAEGRAQAQQAQIFNQMLRINGVECLTKVHEQHLYIYFVTVLIGEGTI